MLARRAVAAARAYAVYAHMPFCRKRCPYCAFTVYAGRDALAHSDQHSRYLHALLDEWSHWRKRRAQADADAGHVRSVFVGGGTPSFTPELTGAFLREACAIITGTAPSTHAPASSVEITVECNPCDAHAYASLVRAGATRLSIGVQSLDDGDLRQLGRAHDARQAREAVRAARHAGARSVSVDLMHGVPHQTRDSWRATLSAVLDELQPDHLSLYGLHVYADTPFGRRQSAGRLPLPRDDDTADMYSESVAMCAARGYEQYEISNFCRPGHACAHNLAYWTGVPYVGLGVGAHSFDGERHRWHNTRDISTYVQSEEARGAAREHDRLSEQQRFLEEVMLRLRLTELGVPRRVLERHPGVWARALQLAAGAEPLLAVRAAGTGADEERVVLTPRGVLLADAVTVDVLRTVPAA